jgi:hypothetical protein
MSFAGGGVGAVGDLMKPSAVHIDNADGSLPIANEGSCGQASIKSKPRHIRWRQDTCSILDQL